MSTNNEKQQTHPRLGYRKPGAKRATLALRMTDFNKAMLKAQAAAAGKSISDHVVALALENQINPFFDPYPTPPRPTPQCPNCKSGAGSTVPNYDDVSCDVLPKHVEDAMNKGLTPFACLRCGHAWFDRWPTDLEHDPQKT